MGIAIIATMFIHIVNKNKEFNIFPVFDHPSRWRVKYILGGLSKTKLKNETIAKTK
jgi:hypothetical protein